MFSYAAKDRLRVRLIQSLPGGVVWAAAGRRAGAGARILGSLLMRMLGGFVMADHTTGGSSQHTVMTCHVARHPTDGCALQAAFRVDGRSHHAGGRRD